MKPHQQTERKICSWCNGIGYTGAGLICIVYNGQPAHISPSMAVNTKPQDRIEYKGRLIYFEYGTPESIIEEVKKKLGE
jgi:hypothetical protein